MKIKKIRQSALLLMGILLASSQLFSQDHAFQVLAVDGEVTYKKAEEWIVVEAGQSLQPEDMLKMNGNAYLGLVHHSGHTLELKKAGTYDVSRLSRELGARKLEMTAKYADLYVSTINGGNTNKSALPSTERSASATKVALYLPNSVDVFNDEVILRWKDQGNLDEKYEVKLKNMFNEVLDVKEVDGTKATLNFKNEKIAKERMIIVSINNKEFKDQKSNDYGMKQLTPEEAERISRELNELKLEITDQQSALDKLILASFYEQNSLLADALTSYEYAITLAPDIAAFQKAYEQFIFRNGLGN